MSKRVSILFILLSFCGPFAVAKRAENPAAVVRLQSSEYISKDQAFFREGAEDNNNSIAVGVDDEFKWRFLRARVFLKNEYSATEQWNYFNVYDLHASAEPVKGGTLSVGRKLERWNEWEEDFRQGVFQPRYMQNRLRPEYAGLTGAFYTQDFKRAAFTIGVLPVHIPDLGAHFSVEDNKLVSKNPWFNPPAPEFILQDVSGEIRYSVRKPPTEEIVLKPGAVAKAEFHQGRYFGRVAAAYKPMPALLTQFPSFNRVVVTPTEDYMSVEVQPRVAYHALYSHDSVVKLGSWTTQASVTREAPDNERPPEGFTAQRARPAWIYALGVSRPLETEGRYAARMKLGFMRVEGGDGADSGYFAKDRSLFEGRYQYTEAYLLAVNKPWRGLGRYPLDTEIRLLFDRRQNGGALSLASGLNLSPDWRIDLQVDMLGLLPGPRQQEDGFLALYRSNDRVGVGVSYVY